MTDEDRARLPVKSVRVARPIPATWRPRAPTMNRLRMLGLDPEATVAAFVSEARLSGLVSASGWSKHFEVWLREHRKASQRERFGAERAQRETT